MTVPTKTSDGKCFCAFSRETSTRAARPYAMIFVKVPGYSCATTLATDQAAAACSEGKETPPWRNWPLPVPSSGRCRPNEYFIPSTTTRLFNAASPERNPVSRQCSLCVSWLSSHIPPAPPTSAARDALEMLLYRLIVFGL